MKGMFDNWLESIKTMGVFLVCAQTLIHFMPKGAYEKYIRLLVSIMLLVQLVEPIGSMFGFLQKGELQRRIRNMEYRLEQVQQQSYAIEADAENIWSMLLEDVEWETVEGAEQEAQE